MVTSVTAQPDSRDKTAQVCVNKKSFISLENLLMHYKIYFT